MNDHFDFLPSSGAEFWIVPLTEVLAEVGCAMVISKSGEVPYSRSFQEWRWWRNRKAYDEVQKLVAHILRQGITNIVALQQYAFHDPFVVCKAKEIAKVMQNECRSVPSTY